MSTGKLTKCALFASVALIIFAVEALIPPLVPIPGFKIGLANTVTLCAIYILGVREAFLILVVRILLGNMFTGQMMSLAYSLCGGLLCFGGTALLKNMFGGNTLWALGVAGALLHNVGQTLCALLLFRSPSVLYYGGLLCLISIVTGTFTGFCAQFTINFFKEKRK